MNQILELIDRQKKLFTTDMEEYKEELEKKNFETFDALNSFYDMRFAKNEAKQIKDLNKYIKNWNSDKNLVLITHFVVISSILNTSSSSGEIIISDKNFNIIGSVNTM